MTHAGFPPIRELLPHAGNMVLLDDVVEAGDTHLVARVEIRPDMSFVRSDGLPAWFGIELMAQAAAALGGLRARSRGEAPRAGLLLGTRHYESSVPAFAQHSVLEVRVEEAMRADNGMQSLACTIRSGGRVLAEAYINVFEPPQGVATVRADDAPR